MCKFMRFFEAHFSPKFAQYPPPLSFLFLVVLLCFSPFLSLFLRLFAILSLELASTFSPKFAQYPPPLSFLFLVVLLCFSPFLSLFLRLFAILSLELASTVAEFSCDHQSCDRNSVHWSMFDIFLPIAGN